MEENRRYRVNSPQVISENIEGELVMINLLRGSYHSAEGSGTVIWGLIEQGVNTKDIVTTLSASSNVAPSQLRRPVEAFLDELVEAELIVPSENDAGAVTTEPRPDLLDGRSFTTPTLNTYTDMADILMLDPVHDVDEKGWPQPMPASDPE